MNINSISGSGGSEQSTTAVDSPDTLKSKSYASVLDLLCEGEIEGLVTGDEQSIYINGTPIKNADGTYNYKDFEYNFKTGTQNQEYIPGFNSVESEVVGPGQVLKNISKATEVIADETVDRVRVTLAIPSLVTYADNGDTRGSEVHYNITLSKNSGSDEVIVNKIIEGKTTSRYQFSHIITLNRTAPTDIFLVKVLRITDDSTDLKLQNDLYFDSYTKIADTKLRYPNSALCGVKIASSQFSSVPNRGYYVKLLKVRVPSNYDPITRVYDGVWDGTFKAATWTDNPAWCFYDLVTNDRYGLGEYIDVNLVDKWSLYTISQYCDELVPTGYSINTEPRFTLNTYIQTREDAIKLLTDLAGTFRGMVYWGGGTITLSQDSNSNSPSMIFNNSNVINGQFNYSGASKKVIHSAALVSWNDPQALYTQKIEYVEDRESIARYGYNPTEIVAFGCTSRSQAHRVGKWLLYTEKVESNIISFSAGLDSSYCRPGDIIKVFDDTLVTSKFSGRVINLTSTSVTLDREVVLEVGKTYTIKFNVQTSNIINGQTVRAFSILEYTITTVAGTTNILDLSTTLDSTIGISTIYSIVDPSLSESLYRLISIKESNNLGIYELVGMLHNPSKFNYIEQNLQLEDRVYTTLNRVPLEISRGSITHSESLYLDSTGKVECYLTFSFSPSTYATSYKIELKREQGNWETIHYNSTTTSNTIYKLADSTIYHIRITPQNGNKLGPATYINNILVIGKSAPPSDIPWIFINEDELVFGEVSDLDLAGYRIKTIINGNNISWDTATLETTELIKATKYKLSNYSTLQTVMVKAVDTTGNESLNPAVISTTIDPLNTDNIFTTISEKPTWSGTKTNFTVNGSNNLISTANSTSLMWASNLMYPTGTGLMYNNPTDIMYNSTLMYSSPTSLFYNSAAYPDSRYTTVAYDMSTYLSSSLYEHTKVYLDYSFTADNIQVEYTTIGNELYWTQPPMDPATVPAWNTGDSGVPAWSITLPVFVPYTNAGIELKQNSGFLIFRIGTKPSAIQTTISKFDIIIDMPDIIVNISNKTIAIGGTRITEVIGRFSTIVAINATLFGTNNAMTVKVMDRDSVNGPLIQCYDSAGSAIAGVVDLNIKGY